MQVFAIVLLLVAGSSANSIKQISESGPVCPLPRVYMGPEGPLNVTYHPILEIHQGASHGVSTINGLNSYAYQYTVNVAALTIDLSITIGSLTLDATYTATGYFDAAPFSQGCIPSGNFTSGGYGPATARATVVGLRVVWSFTLYINIVANQISMTHLSVTTFSFTTMMINLGENFQIDGAPIDWPVFNGNLGACFNTEFAANKDLVAEKVRLAINNKLADCTLEDFMDYLPGIVDPTCPPPDYTLKNIE